MAGNADVAEDCRLKDLEYATNSCLTSTVFFWHVIWQLTYLVHRLLRSGNFADVEIVCGERTWKCHRAILTSRSVWFHKALSGPFQVRARTNNHYLHRD